MTRPSRPHRSAFLKRVRGNGMSSARRWKTTELPADRDLGHGLGGRCQGPRVRESLPEGGLGGGYERHSGGPIYFSLPPANNRSDRDLERLGRLDRPKGPPPSGPGGPQPRVSWARQLPGKSPIRVPDKSSPGSEAGNHPAAETGHPDVRTGGLRKRRVLALRVAAPAR